ncbi:MAG TPA: hypothetical protein VH253_17060 [Phycisphaerae bacterium]|nr:hypothetical protein [Phycisphaerae bacterium]
MSNEKLGTTGIQGDFPQTLAAPANCPSLAGMWQLIVVGNAMLATDPDGLGPTHELARSEMQKGLELWAANHVQCSTMIYRPNSAIMADPDENFPFLPGRGLLLLCVEFGKDVAGMLPFRVAASIREQVSLPRDGRLRAVTTFEVTSPLELVIEEDFLPVRTAVLNVMAVLGSRLSADNPPPARCPPPSSP